MFTAPTTISGYFSDDLPTIAALAETGEPGMSFAAVAQMFACILADESLFEQSIVQIQENHFQAGEIALAYFHQALIAAHNQTHRRPTLQEVGAAVSQRIREEQNQSNGLTPAGFNESEMHELFGQVDVQLRNGCTPELGKSLVHRFLAERGVLAPILTISARCQTSQISCGYQFPRNMEALVRLSSGRLEELDAEWGSGEPWGDPVPLEGPTLPAFPLDSLPTPLRNWVQAVSVAKQVPTDLPAMFGVSVCAAGAAKAVEVEVRPGWREPINIYTTCVLDVGTRKSPIFNDATGPIREFERDAVEQMRPRVTAYETRANILR